MGEIIEEFFNGYCRNFDMTQTVICEFEQFPEGPRIRSLNQEEEAPLETARIHRLQTVSFQNSDSIR